MCLFGVEQKYCEKNELAHLDEDEEDEDDDDYDEADGDDDCYKTIYVGGVENGEKYVRK
jgi:hypothetical protein